MAGTFSPQEKRSRLSPTFSTPFCKERPPLKTARSARQSTPTFRTAARGMSPILLESYSQPKDAEKNSHLLRKSTVTSFISIPSQPATDKSTSLTTTTATSTLQRRSNTTTPSSGRATSRRETPQAKNNPLMCYPSTRNGCSVRRRPHSSVSVPSLQTSRLIVSVGCNHC